MTKYARLASVSDLTKHRAEVAHKLVLRHYERTPSDKKFQILVCGGTGCTSSGSKRVVEALQTAIDAYNIQDQCDIITTGCHGFCETGPLVILYPGGTFYVRVKPEDCEEIIVKSLLGTGIIERLLFVGNKGIPRATYRDVSFYRLQHRLVLHNCGHIDPEDLDEYIATGGYAGLGKALTELGEEGTLNEVKASNVRGRGGAGFPTGKKWEFTRMAKGDLKYVVCNADEGDPGAFMDRSVLEGDPHAVIEGMAIGAFAIGATEGYVYVRAEYPLAIRRLRVAIAQAEEAGLLGDSILGTNFSFHLHIKEGAGAFVCGEETALLQSIEGQRGMPRPRPPFPANSGLWGKPTVLNNVETFANIPRIITAGAAEYVKLGTPTSTGTKVFALTGKVKNTGLVEVPMGTSMREIIFEIGGGIQNGKSFKAVQIGGPSGACLPESLLDSPVDYDSLTAVGAMMGSGGLVVVDEDTCMVDLARFFLSFTQAESCGKCTPCREGTKRMLEILERICDGKGKAGDIELLEHLASNIKQSSLCALGQTAPNPVLSTLRFFRHEYEAHIVDKKCPAKACANLLEYWINPETCIACGLCQRACPADAISGEKKEVRVIDTAKCVKCGSCMTACKKTKAITRR